MSVKHVNQYFNELYSTYHELLLDLKDLEKEASQGLVSPEFMDRYKKSIEPIKTNYERWSYMMFLLNQPNKKEKKRKYLKQHAKDIEYFKENNLDKIDKEESLQALEKVKNRDF